MWNRVWKLTRFELAKLSRQWFVYLCFAIAIGMAWLGIRITDGALEGFWKRTGFDYIDAGLSMAGALLPLILVILGSRAVSGEAASGTLRTVLTRPLTRTDYVLAKVLSMVVLSTALFLATAAFAEAYAWWKADRFRALYETYPVAGRYGVNPRPIHTVPELVRETVRDVALLYLPLVSAAVFGLFISVLFDNEGVSVSISCLTFLPYLLCAGIYPSAGYKAILGKDHAQWLAQYHLITPLDKLRLFTEGMSHSFRWEAGEIRMAVGVPLLYIVVFSLLSVLVFRSRDVLV